MMIWYKKRLYLLGLGLLLLYGCIPAQGVDTQEIKDTGTSVEEKYLEKGLACYKNGNLDSAILLFAECLKLNPDNQQARKLFEEALKMKGMDEKGAEKIPFKEETQPLKQPFSVNNNAIPSMNIKADSLTPLIAQQKSSLEKTKKELSSHRREGLKEIELPQPDGTSIEQAKAEQAKAIDEKQVMDFNFAKDMYNKGLFDAATAEFKSLLDKYPGSILKEKMLYLLTNSLIKAKKYPESIDTAKRLIDINGEFANDGLYQLAQAYEMSGNLKQAQVEYLKAASYGNTNSMTSVTKNVRKILDETPPYPSPRDELIIKSHLSAGNAYKNDGEYERSLFEYYRVITDYPKTEAPADAYFRIGEIYQNAYRIRDFQKAYDAYQKIVKQYPLSPWAKKAKKQADYLWENYLR
ncbi:MAG: tetratricopeptide repeat protein [Candidatus Desantisbacteria bacterium]